MPHTPAAQRLVGLGLGAVVLGLIVLLAVGLPRLQGDTDVPEPPADLPGGWTATDALDPADLPEEVAANAEELIEQQRTSRDYVEQAYAEVYEEAPTFRAYTDETFSAAALVTVFATDGGSFAPAEGVLDPEAAGLEHAPVELVRRDDAVCSVSYQAVAAGQGEAEHEPTAVTCQRDASGRTVQLTTRGVALDDTVALLDDLAAALA